MGPHRCGCGCGRVVPEGEMPHPECPACQDASVMFETDRPGAQRTDHTHGRFAIMATYAGSDTT